MKFQDYSERYFNVNILIMFSGCFQSNPPGNLHKPANVALFFKTLLTVPLWEVTIFKISLYW
jgi:hypothetical protein